MFLRSAALSRRAIVKSPGARRGLAFVSPNEEPEFDKAYGVVSPVKNETPAVYTQSVVDSVRLSSKDFKSPIVEVKFAMRAGSASEKPDEKGSAQFLSVAGFAGTKKRTGLGLFRRIENVGAVVSCTADREKIEWNLKVLPEHIEPAFAYVAEAVASRPYALYVYDEIKPTAQFFYDEYNSSPVAQLKDILHEAAYGEGSPYGSSFFATSVKKVDAENVAAFRRTHFRADNTLITAKGLSHEALVKLTAAFYRSIVPTKLAASSPPSATFVGGFTKVKLPGEVTHAALAFPVPAGEASKPYAVLNEILSAKIGKSKVAESFLTTYCSGGLIGVYLTGPTTGDLLAGIVSDLKAVASSSIPAGEIEAAKAKLTFAALSGLDGDATTSTMLSALLSGSSPSAYANYSGVTAASVASAAGSLLKTASPAYAILGSAAGTKNYVELLNLLK